MAKITQAQLRFLDKVIRTTSCACDTIGEWRVREACRRNGWLAYRDTRKGYPMATYITDAARAAMASAGHPTD